MSDDRNAPWWQRAWEEIRCSISVFSDNVTAAQITGCVGVAPTKARIKDEPISAQRPHIRVPRHIWTWQVDDAVERSLDAQLDALWSALGSKADAFRRLPPGANVQLSIWITHCGTELSLGWSLDRRHVAAAAAFGAAIDIDEYDDTESGDAEGSS